MANVQYYGTGRRKHSVARVRLVAGEGNIIVNENMSTNVPNLYACGDCTGGILQIAKAVYEGMIAGMNVIKSVKK